MIVLGLDQSPNVTGYAWGDGTGAPRLGQFIHSDFGDNESRLMHEFAGFLATLVKSSGAEAVFTEQIVVYPHRLHMPSLHKQFALVHAVAFVCHPLGVAHYEAPVSSWRHWFLGMGSAPKGVVNKTQWAKETAERECLDRGWLPENHHMAEAAGIWSYGLAELDRSYRHRTKARQRRAELTREREAAA